MVFARDWFSSPLSVAVARTSQSPVPMWQNPLRSFGYAESGILPHRFGGLHPQMLLVATRTSHICEFAKSQERKQTSFSGLRKSAEPLCAMLPKQRHRKKIFIILPKKLKK